ncbi:hypothetical protein EYF80_001797 [Liparis tanakae]|uniref:Uncharacterized protein n=1 Tax=Liparis tanakae TaxID=230148 RepID=A0A4Z2JDK2_9TELE|nr:hypothetical protein EYF80_001797 [Liparis tanakae]
MAGLCSVWAISGGGGGGGGGGGSSALCLCSRGNCDNTGDCSESQRDAVFTPYCKAGVEVKRGEEGHKLQYKADGGETAEIQKAEDKRHYCEEKLINYAYEQPKLTNPGGYCAKNLNSSQLPGSGPKNLKHTKAHPLGLGHVLSGTP